MYQACVVKLVNTSDSKSDDLGLEGSSPSTGTILSYNNKSTLKNIFYILNKINSKFIDTNFSSSLHNFKQYFIYQ